MLSLYLAVLLVRQLLNTVEFSEIVIIIDIVVNEALLTGESVPVTKTAVSNDPSKYYDLKENSRNTLFSGTEVIQTKHLKDQKTLVLVQLL